MIGVFDTSVISNLCAIDTIEILPRLFSRVLIPEAVHLELLHPHAPAATAKWIAAPPPWLEIYPNPESQLPGLENLHDGERAVIELAAVLSATAALDEKAARRAARALGLQMVGLVGILGQAAMGGWVDLPTVVERLRQTNFRVAPQLLRRLLQGDFSH